MSFLDSVSGSAWGFSGIDYGGTYVMKRANEREARQAWERETEFAERMSNTAWQRGVEDMKAAGLNPMLAYQQGPATAPSPHAQVAQIGPVSAGGNNTMSYQTAAQTALLSASADKTRAEADEVRARTPTYEVSMDKMRQDIAESMERIYLIKADVTAKQSTAARNYQQIENLRAELPRIKADTTRILAHARNFAASTSLTTAHEKEVQQRLRQDLPQIERAIQALQLTMQEMELPGKMADETAKASFIGQLGAYAEAIKPFATLIGGAIFGGGMLQGKPTTTPPLIHKGTGGNPSIHRR